MGAYASLTTLAIYDRSIGHNALIRSSGMPIVGTGQFSPDGRYLAAVGFGTATSLIRADRDTDVDGVFDEAGAVDVGAVALITWDGHALATDGAAHLVVVPAFPFVGGMGIRDLRGPVPPPFDLDADGLGDAFESRVGLSPSSAAGADGANGDPDADGRTNAGAARGHPSSAVSDALPGRRRDRRFFSTRMPSQPGSAVSRVLLRYLTDTGQTTSTTLVVPPMFAPVRLRRAVCEPRDGVILDGHRGGRADRG